MQNVVIVDSGWMRKHRRPQAARPKPVELRTLPRTYLSHLSQSSTESTSKIQDGFRYEMYQFVAMVRKCVRVDHYQQESGLSVQGVA